MFTSMDKALVALVMGVLFIMNSVFGVSLGFTEAQVAGVIGILTPILVWAIPNRTAG